MSDAPFTSLGKLFEGAEYDEICNGTNRTLHYPAGLISVWRNDDGTYEIYSYDLHGEIQTIDGRDEWAGLDALDATCLIHRIINYPEG